MKDEADKAAAKIAQSTHLKNDGHSVHTAVYYKKIVSKPAYKGKVMIEISITYPQADVPGNAHTSRRINNFYHESATQYYDYAMHTLFDQAVQEYLYRQHQHFQFLPYEVLQTFENPYNRASLLSIYYDRYEYTAGAHGNTVRAADTWQLSAGARLKLSDFFDDSYYRSVIFEFITNDIKRQIDEGNSYYFDDYAKNVFRYFDEENYYLTDTGIAIFYPLYTIAAYAQGIPVFIVPYEAFGGSLKKGLFK